MKLRAPILSLICGSLLLSSCHSGPNTSPINTTLNLKGVPQLDGTQNPQSVQEIFNFKIITPMEHVDAFSILQATADTPSNHPQVTLPVDQLQAVKLAKERIIASEFLKPEVAGDAAYRAAEQYQTNTELARQILIEISSFYTNERNKAYESLRLKVIADREYYQKQNLLKHQEINKNAAEFVKEGFPQREPLTVDERKKWILEHVQRMEDARKANLKRIAENNKQAQAALKVVLAQLEEKRKKDEERQKKLQEELQRNVQTFIDSQKQQFTTLATPESPTYQLVALNTGEFVVEAGSQSPLPAVIELELKEFSYPVPIPVLNHVNSGRALISLSKDPSGRPRIYGGYEAAYGGQIDLSQPLFTVQYQNGDYVMNYLDTLGHVYAFKLDPLKDKEAKALQGFNFAQQETLSQDNLAQFKTPFSAIHYVLTPQLSQMPSEQALEVLDALPF